MSLFLQGVGCSRGGAPDPDPDLATPLLLDLARGSDDAGAPADLAVRDLSMPDLLLPDLTLPPDLAGPTAAECFERWRMYGGTCPAPVITQAWAATTGCSGGNPGLFIEGMNFQLEMRNMGIADYGPQCLEGHDQKHWNELTTTRLCVTMNATYALSFPGKRLSVRNPDGKVSNSVTIMRR
ncbi:MAG: hypothetical protein U1A78_32955 [Polyangia bacterium]